MLLTDSASSVQVSPSKWLCDKLQPLEMKAEDLTASTAASSGLMILGQGDISTRLLFDTQLVILLKRSFCPTGNGGEEGLLAHTSKVRMPSQCKRSGYNPACVCVDRFSHLLNSTTHKELSHHQSPASSQMTFML